MVVGNEYAAQAKIKFFKRLYDWLGVTWVNGYGLLAVVYEPDIVILKCWNGYNLNIMMHTHYHLFYTVKCQ